MAFGDKLEEFEAALADATRSLRENTRERQAATKAAQGREGSTLGAIGSTLARATFGFGAGALAAGVHAQAVGGTFGGGVTDFAGRAAGLLSGDVAGFQTPKDRTAKRLSDVAGDLGAAGVPADAIAETIEKLSPFLAEQEKGRAGAEQQVAKFAETPAFRGQFLEGAGAALGQKLDRIAEVLDDIRQRLPF